MNNLEKENRINAFIEMFRKSLYALPYEDMDIVFRNVIDKKGVKELLRTFSIIALSNDSPITYAELGQETIYIELGKKKYLRLDYEGNPKDD